MGVNYTLPIKKFCSNRLESYLCDSQLNIAVQESNWGNSANLSYKNEVQTVLMDTITAAYEQMTYDKKNLWTFNNKTVVQQMGNIGNWVRVAARGPKVDEEFMLDVQVESDTAGWDKEGRFDCQAVEAAVSRVVAGTQLGVRYGDVLGGGTVQVNVNCDSDKVT